MVIPQGRYGAVSRRKAETMIVSGTELKVGDTIETWWKPNRDTITSLRPYHGPLNYLWDGKAQIATFALLKTGMTIEPQGRYVVVNRLNDA